MSALTASHRGEAENLPTPALITAKPNLSGLDALFAEYGRKPLRFRELEVSDEHVQALLIAMTDHLIRQRQLKVEPTLAEREMLAVLTDMVAA